MRLPLSCLLIFLLPSLCLAWGGEGHQLVALIAENQLTPQATQRVRELLDGAHISDAEVASWADEVRRERKETAPWHYVNIPVEEDQYKPARDGRDGNNVIDALDAQVKILADKTQPKEKRAEALKFVVHLVGDIHQPLHCAERNHDKGGNARLVFYPGRREAVSLHFVWDTLLIRDIIGKRKIADAASALERAIRPGMPEVWRKGTTEDWANESHKRAGASAYLSVPADGPPPRLQAPYVQQATGSATWQIQQAGIRLAMVLNQTLK